MFEMLILALGLLGSAHAAPPSETTSAESGARKGPFSGTPIEEKLEEKEKEKSEEAKRVEERLKALNAARAGAGSRVVVLQSGNTDVDYKNVVLRRNILSRIGRADAKFYPDVDLYQAGRKERDKTVRPLDQRAIVPDEIIPQLLDATNEVSRIPWNGLSQTDWGVTAARLKNLADSVWFIDRVELREPIFQLYVQIGRAATEANNPVPPYFEQVAGVDVNYYYYLAAAMASRDPGLMSKLIDPDTYQTVEHFRQMLDRGEFSPMTLNFELGGDFLVEEFTTEYEVYFNGLQDQIVNDTALYDVPPGKMDVYLKRADDGYGMSVRMESVKVNDQKLESPREQARKRMGIDFIDQLMKNPEQCIPDVEGDILNYLAIYQKLHGAQEVYIAVPEAGSVYKILLWKWVPDKGTLIRIGDNTGGFPIRFVGLVGTGVTFSGATTKKLDETDVVPPTDLEAANLDTLLGLARFTVGSIPIGYELRAHWNRLVVGFGMDFALSASSDRWYEIPRTELGGHIVRPDSTRNSNRLVYNPNGTPYMRDYLLQRGIHTSIGGVLGKDAAAGFGFRVAGRATWYNAPHAFEPSIHGGWSTKVSRKKEGQNKDDTRVHGIVDLDFFAGGIIPYGDTIHRLSFYSVGNDGGAEALPGGVWGRKVKGGTSGQGCVEVSPDNDAGVCRYKAFGKVLPNFGFTAKVGLTF